MKRSRFKEEQIIAILREQEAGSPTADVCRKHGVSSAAFYKWKAKFGGLDVSDAKLHHLIVGIAQPLTDEDREVRLRLVGSIHHGPTSWTGS